MRKCFTRRERAENRKKKRKQNEKEFTQNKSRKMKSCDTTQENKEKKE